jgi:hypothetical protein
MRNFLNPHDNPLSREEIEAIAPSVYALQPASHVSEDYHFVNTGEVLDILGREGWQPFQAKQQKVRNPDKREGTKHMVSLRNSRIDVTGMDIGGLLPTFTIVNSHDWSSRFKVMVGMFRLICSNGMMISSGVVQGFNIRHDHITEDIEIVMARFSSNATKILEMARNWDNIQLDEYAIQQFSLQAAKIRFGEDSDNLESKARALNTARRSQDAGNTLWRIFNRIQENSIKGGVKFQGMKRRIRSLSNIDAEVDVNNDLFNLAATFDPSRLS